MKMAVHAAVLVLLLSAVCPPSWAASAQETTLNHKDKELLRLFKEELKNNNLLMEAKLNNIETKLNSIEKVMETRFQGIEYRFQGIDQRFQAIDQRITDLRITMNTFLTVIVSIFTILLTFVIFIIRTGVPYLTMIIK
ncbi:MAG: hypothetical protein HQL01_06070 [Nitrospirae bacterium]|nr:hypothetical protein [Nitrospirota bacterium]